MPSVAVVVWAGTVVVATLAAHVVFEAVTFAGPLWMALAVLGACWFVALFVLCHLALRWRRRHDAAAPLPLMRAP